MSVDKHTPAYQTHLLRNGPRWASETGLAGKCLASRDGMDEFHHWRNLILWLEVVEHVATIWSFSKVISGTSLELQWLSTWNTKNTFISKEHIIMVTNI